MVKSKLTRLEKSRFWVIDALIQDKDYYNAWRANIAMCMYDALMKEEELGPIDTCNLAADKFLKILINGGKK